MQVSLITYAMIITSVYCFTIILTRKRENASPFKEMLMTIIQKSSIVELGRRDADRQNMIKQALRLLLDLNRAKEYIIEGFHPLTVFDIADIIAWYGALCAAIGTRRARGEMRGQISFIISIT